MSENLAVIPPKQHSELGPSSAKRWMNCQGARNLIRTVPELPSNFFAAEGTLAHEIVEEGIKNLILKLDNPAAVIWTEYPIGKRFLVDGHVIEVTQEMIDAVLICLRYVADIVEKNRVSAQNIWPEKDVKIPGSKVIEGTMDCGIFMLFRKLIVIDYKHGKGVEVRVTRNEQLMLYALGALHSLLSDAQRATITEVEIVIVQPRIPGALNGGITSVTYSIAALNEFLQEALEAERKTEDPAAPRKAGEWCKWCPAELACAERQGFSQAVVDFSQFKEPEFKPSLPVAQLYIYDDEYLERIAINAPLIRSYLDKAEEIMEDRALQGLATYSQFKVVEKIGNTRWVNKDAALAAFQTALGDKATTTAILSPAQMLKVLEQEFPEYDAKAGIEALTERPRNGKTLVPLKDKRPAIAVSVGEDFKSVALKKPE